MQENYQVTKAPTVAATNNTGHTSPVSLWTNPNRILVDDSSNATWGAFMAGQGAEIVGSVFGYVLPPGAVIDGVQVTVQGSQTGCFGNVTLNIAGTTGKAISALNGSYGSATDLWGATEIDPADIASLAVSVDTEDTSGGDGFASMDYMTVTVSYHIDLTTTPAEVPTRVVYKAYARSGRYLGELPNVSSPFGFPQDINTPGSTIQITCGASIETTVTSEPLLTEDDEPLETEDGQDILANVSTPVIARGDSDDEVIFKNSNRIKVWVYNYWYPNGKLMFSGQVNHVGFSYGGGKAAVNLTVLSDGLDMGNYIARGFPFTYTNDVSQTSQNGFVTVFEDSHAGWLRYGQTYTKGGGVTNEGAIALMLQGSANVTIGLYDAPNGNFIGSVTQFVSVGSPTVVQFNFATMLPITGVTTPFFAVSVAAGQSINVYRHSTSTTYTGGSLYESSYSGGSGGGSYGAVNGDMYFVTKYGTPSTTTTFSSKDPVTNMASDVLADYNTRGGYIKRRNFLATGLSLSYTFSMATISDVVKKALELAPTGYYYYVDLGTAEIDILPQSVTADFTVVRGKDVHQLDLDLSIEQAKNYLLFSGGDTGGGTNLYKEYADTASAGFYGPRYVPKSDNRVTAAATANAIGETFIEENAAESQETTVTIPMRAMDISKLVPGKTIGFRNFGNFIDDMVLLIVRREFTLKSVTLTLGRLPVRMNDEVQRLTRELQDQQTQDNPTAPS